LAQNNAFFTGLDIPIINNSPSLTPDLAGEAHSTPLLD